MGTVYLLHFHRNFSHARHYLGYASSKVGVEARLEQHRAGTGARIMAAVVLAGIGFDLVSVWEDGSRALERSLKRRKDACSLCPVCQADRKRRKAATMRRLRQRRNLAPPLPVCVIGDDIQF